MMPRSTAVLLLLVGFISPARTAEPPPYARWGAETLSIIRKDLWLPKLALYAEQAADENGIAAAPAFMWGAGVQLSALAAAAAVEPDTFLAETRAYAEALQVYWLEHDGKEGFDVQPGPKISDRYYDDNAWLVLALAEVFEVTHDRKFLDRSVATFRFVTSGEDDQLGGGLYWKENFLASKNTCTNAPAIVGALRLHRLTGEAEYLATAKRWYAWTTAHLQDEDGLFWDNIRLDGRVSRRKFSYNSALMIRANCLLHQTTGEPRYLEEAQRMAHAADRLWVRDDGAISDSGKFAHLLLEAFLALHDRDHDSHWTDLVARTLAYVHDTLLGPDGRYPPWWNRRSEGSRKDSMLLNQACAARAFWVGARALK